jgi:hypothetical protein
MRPRDLIPLVAIAACVIWGNVIPPDTTLCPAPTDGPQFYCWLQTQP